MPTKILCTKEITSIDQQMTDSIIATKMLMLLDVYRDLCFLWQVGHSRFDFYLPSNKRQQ